MAKRRHTSARGEQVDFDLLHHQNKNTIAIGNANMNANGDVLGKGGKVVRRVEDIPTKNMADPNTAYNEANPKSTKMVSLKSKIDDLPPVSDTVLDNEEIKEKKAAKKVIEEEAIIDEQEESTNTTQKPKNKRKIVDSEE